MGHIVTHTGYSCVAELTGPSRAAGGDGVAR
jgi:hypothetical protein